MLIAEDGNSLVGYTTDWELSCATARDSPYPEGCAIQLHPLYSKVASVNGSARDRSACEWRRACKLVGMPAKTKSPRRRQKPVYRIRNWAEYDRALVARGSLTVWFSDDGVAGWGPPSGPRARGGQVKSSDQVIEATLTLKAVFHLTNRAVAGFLGSLCQRMGLALAVPDHTTLSLRGRTVRIDLSHYGDGPLEVVLDSTRLKVYGEGEWKVRQHGVSKRRTWRKLHLGLIRSRA